MSELGDVVVVRPRSGTVVVEFQGEHDVLTKKAVRDLLEREIEQNELVVADISEAQFIDSSFVQSLLLADRKSRSEGKRFVLQVGEELIVQRAVEVSRVLEILAHARTREEALELAGG